MIQDYATTVTNIIEPSNIRYTYRTSHNRVCLYLSAKEMAYKLTKVNINIK